MARIISCRSGSSDDGDSYLSTLTLAPRDAACWICLGEGDDTDGQLRRACACRGESAGFAHLSCLAEYAKQKCKVVPDWMAADFTTPWVYCSNCEQPFMGTLGLDMANEFVSFVETTYSGNNSTWNKVKVLGSILVKLQSMCNVLSPPSDIISDDDLKMREDGKILITKYFALIDVAKQDKELYQDCWVHLSKSSEKYQNYLAFRISSEAGGYETAGRFYSLVDKSENSGNIGLRYYQKANIIFNLLAPNMGLGLRRDIAKLQARLGGVSSGSEHTSLKEAKHEYEQAIKLSKDIQHSDRVGKTSEIILIAGSVNAYVEALLVEFHIVKAERLAKDFELKCRRFLGPEHHTTKRAAIALENCKRRLVRFLSIDHKYFFIALNHVNGGGHVCALNGGGHICAFKYVDTNTQTASIQIGQYSGERYVVTGPITDQGEVKEKREFYVACEIVFPCPGCPVICHGLKAATHLNGKLGSLSTGTKYHTELARGNKQFVENKDVRCTVYFDDESLKSASVKLENLRIVFDLDRFD